MQEEIQVLGIPGSENFKKEFVTYLENFKKIYIHNERDAAGKKFVEKISMMIPSDNVYEIASSDVDSNCKDPSDLYIKGNLKLELLLATAKRIKKINSTPKNIKTLKKFEKDNSVAQHVEIAEKILKKLYIKFFNEDFYVYDNGVYSRNKHIIELAILEINSNASTNLRREILGYIQIKTFVKEKKIEERFINFQNGLFDLTEQKFIEHSPEIFSTIQIHANFIESDNLIINEYMDNFLSDIMCHNNDRKKALLQITGYAMTTRTDLQLAFFFYRSKCKEWKIYIY